MWSLTFDPVLSDFVILCTIVLLFCKETWGSLKVNLKLLCASSILSYGYKALKVKCVCASATQRQKFHTDNVKSVRNPVRSADLSKQQLHCFSYCLWMTDKKQKATKVKCKRKESLTKQSIFVEYRLLLKKHLNFAGVRGQINTTLYQNRPEDTQN